MFTQIAVQFTIFKLSYIGLYINTRKNFGFLSADCEN
jgi:hypothetical protein